MTAPGDPGATAPRRAADFPRPPAIEHETRRIVVVLGGVVIADAPRSFRILETTHPPSYYLPPDSFRPGSLQPGSERASFCEWKGHAHYLTLVGGNRREKDCAWAYADPAAAYAELRDHVALYAGRMDRCTVGGEVVVPQEGGFYGGWITSDVIGPFKGPPGTSWW